MSAHQHPIVCCFARRYLLSSHLLLLSLSRRRLSHKKHHLNHNHLTADYSHQWFVREEDPLSGVWWMDLSHKTRMVRSCES